MLYLLNTEYLPKLCVVIAPLAQTQSPAVTHDATYE